MEWAAPEGGPQGGLAMGARTKSGLVPNPQRVRNALTGKLFSPLSSHVIDFSGLGQILTF